MALPALAAIPLFWKILGGTAIAGGMYGKNIWEMILQNKTAGRQLSLQEKMMAGELEASKSANEANRKAAEEYLSMFQREKSSERAERSKDRQMAMIMAMLQGMGQMRQQGIDTMTTVNQPLPPMALTTLLRGR